MSNTSSDFEKSWISALDRALRDPALAGPSLPEREAAAPNLRSERKRASLRLAAAIGDCRLHDAKIPQDLEGVLPESIALDAAGALVELLQQLAVEIANLPELADRAESPQLEFRIQDVLQGRMTAWAAIIAVGEAEWEFRSDALSSAIRDAQRAIHQIDDLLTTPDNLIILSTVTSTPALENMRATLAAEYQECLPWWLDGTLEATHDELRRWTDTLMHPQTANRASHSLLHEDFLARLETGHALAAEVGGEGTFSSLVWRSPEGDCRAVLAIPPKFRVDDQFVLVFWRLGKIAADMAGQKCSLGGVDSIIDAQARASFSAGALLERSQSSAVIELRVGESDLPWKREST